MPTNGDSRIRSRASGSEGAGSTTESGMSTSPTGNGSPTDAGVGHTAGQDLLGGIQRKVSSTVDQQKNRAADGIGNIADVFRNAGGELRAQNETLASYVDMASDQMKRFADQIRQRGVEDMASDVAEFARRRPALFIGGAFLVGLSIARFVKSSANRATDYSEYTGADYSEFPEATRYRTSSRPAYTGTGLGEPGGY